MKKIILCLLLLCWFTGCSSKPVEQVIIEKEEIHLPQKENPSSMLASDSPLSAINIDDYLFLEDCYYVDTRSASQLIEEGMIAGFFNIPFYGLIADFKTNDQVLFTITKQKDENGNITALLGDSGSFVPNYDESEAIIKDMFPMDKNIVVISTAGVEATYLLNLLVQIGYDPSKLYNAGYFSNSMGSNIAYRELKTAKYYIEGPKTYTVNYQVSFTDLK